MTDDEIVFDEGFVFDGCDLFRNHEVRLVTAVVARTTNCPFRTSAGSSLAMFRVWGASYQVPKKIRFVVCFSTFRR